jgi:hypothetical protein
MDSKRRIAIGASGVMTFARGDAAHEQLLRLPADALPVLIFVDSGPNVLMGERQN